MIRRIVKMTFEVTACDDFLTMFESKKTAIRSFPGCEHLELWRVTPNGNIFMTYSHWRSVEDLEAYRNSELFKTTWAQTKTWFADRPKAWSLDLASKAEF
ncbi:MAG: antibiotic biosynthesis monooxygenase family protein [Bacteroidota bacterium]